MKGLEEFLGRNIAAWMDAVVRRARLVIALETLASVILGVFVFLTLGVNMDHKRLMAEDLPFRKNAAAFARYFPQLDDSILLLVEGETPEVARTATHALTDRLKQRPDLFSDVYVPGGDPFFQRVGLLYRTPAELDDFTDHLARLQPIMADLSQDASIANMARLIRIGLERGLVNADDPSSGQHWSRVLDRISEATVRAFDDYPVSISWERLMLEGSSFDPGTRQVVIAEPVLDFGSLLAAGDAMEAIHSVANELNLVPERGVRVRITGNPALNYEEMFGLAWDVGVASIFSFALVTGVLLLALRSLRLASAAALTLLAGLIWTAAFAAASVGELNVLSIAFGVLFIGLGVDFAIHLGMHYASGVQRGLSTSAALHDAAASTGSSLLICTVTTAIGFFSFAPTDYRGVAELGLISGVGMLVIFIQTLTLFPALVVQLTGDEPTRYVRSLLRLRLAPPAVVSRHPEIVAALALSIGVLGALQLQWLVFDTNVIKIRDPSTESVQAFNDLLADSSTSPWSVNAMRPDLDMAVRKARKFQALDTVDMTLTLADYVPTDQEEKIEILSDAAMMLDTPKAPPHDPAAVPVAAQVEALRELHAALDAGWLRDAATPLAASARALRDELGRFLDRVQQEKDPAPALADLQRVLLGNFPEQLERLQHALEPPPVTLDSLPRELSHRMLAPGAARIQIFPSMDLSDTAEMYRFVDAVRTVDPAATGVAVNLVELARATARSLQEALVTAFVAIALLLFLLWRRVVDMLLVLLPLVLALVSSGAFMVLSGMPFNFANVVVLPLLLGIGVDSGIHLVHRSHTMVPGEELLATTTARAVFFSAVTTICSFGSLAFSAHRGLASMGTLLVCGMILTLVSNLIVLPALIVLRARWLGGVE